MCKVAMGSFIIIKKRSWGISPPASHSVRWCQDIPQPQIRWWWGAGRNGWCYRASALRVVHFLSFGRKYPKLCMTHIERVVYDDFVNFHLGCNLSVNQRAENVTSRASFSSLKIKIIEWFWKTNLNFFSPRCASCCWGDASSLEQSAQRPSPIISVHQSGWAEQWLLH